MQLIRLVADLTQSTEEINNTFRQTINVEPKSKIALIGLNGAFEYDKIISADDRRITVYDAVPINIDLPLGTYTDQELVNLFQQYLALYAPYKANAPGFTFIFGSEWQCTLSPDNRFDLRRSMFGPQTVPYDSGYSPADPNMGNHVNVAPGNIEFRPSAKDVQCIYTSDAPIPNGSSRFKANIDQPGVEIYQGYYTGLGLKIPGGIVSEAADAINPIVAVVVQGTDLEFEFTSNVPDDLVVGTKVTVAGIADPGGAGAINFADGVVSAVLDEFVTVANVGAGVVVNAPDFSVSTVTFKGFYSYRIAAGAWIQTATVYDVGDEVIIRRGLTAPYENWKVSVNGAQIVNVAFTPAEWTVFNGDRFTTILNTEIYAAGIYGTPKITRSSTATNQLVASPLSLTFDQSTLAKQVGFPSSGRYVSNVLDTDNRIQQLLSPDKVGFLFPNPGLMVLVEPFMLKTYSGSSLDKTPSNILYVVHDPSTQGDSDTIAIDVPSPLFLDINNEFAFNLNQMKVRFSSINGLGVVRLKNRVSVTVAIEG